MLLSRYLVFFFALSSKVVASNYSAAYEALTFYYAHKLEFLAAEGTKAPELARYIAYACTKSFGRVCTFQEFLQTVYGGGGDASLGGYANDGSFDPEDRSKYPNGGSTMEELNKMASDLKGEGFQHAHFNKVELLFGAAGDTFYNEIMSGVADRVEGSIGQLGAEAEDNKDLKATRNGMTGILGERIADDLPGSIDYIVNKIKQRTGLDVKVNEDTESPAGRKYPSIDWFATAENLRNAGLSPNDVDAKIKEISTTLADIQDGNTSYHYQDIVAVEASLDRILPPKQDHADC